jgi:hypothetical protein
MQFLLALSAAYSSIALRVQTGNEQTERCPTEATIEGASLRAMEAAAECMYTERLRVNLKSVRMDDASSWRKGLEETGHVIDTFLAPRFDWQIESEPYPWQNFDSSPSIVLRRNLDPAVQNISRALASKQFPLTCQQHRMLVITDPGRFLGSFAASLVWDFRLFENLLGLRGHPIVSIYNNEEWVLEPRDSTFCEAPDPSGTGSRNRWLCFFLPLTNCSVEGDVLPKTAEERRVGLLVDAADGLAPNAAVRGRNNVKTWRDMMEHFPLNGNRKETSELVGDDLTQVNEAMGNLAMRLEKDDEGSAAVRAFDDETGSPGEGGMLPGFLVRNVLYRRNYRLRSLVAQEIAKHQELEEVVQGKTDCIGVHLRRGDKVDDSYFCSLVDPRNPAFWQAPGFNRTLDEVIDIAASLKPTLFPGTPSSRAKIFVATDTAAFVQDFLKHANASVRKQVLTLGGQDNPFETQNSRLQELAIYWSSQDIASTCKGLVINGDSKTSLVFEWMACSKGSHCPLVKDIKEYRPMEEIQAATSAWDKGIRPDGFKERCESSQLFGSKSGRSFRRQLWQ